MTKRLFCKLCYCELDEEEKKCGQTICDHCSMNYYFDDDHLIHSFFDEEDAIYFFGDGTEDD